MSELFRHLPAMDAVLSHLTAQGEFAGMPRGLLRECAERYLDTVREEIRAGIVADAAELAWERLAPRLTCFVRAAARPHYRRVVNATGVVVHTNLGRSLLHESAVAAVAEACRCYSNLEFDLSTGKRGSRYSHVEALLCSLTGAEAAVVVNNNAAAVLLILESLAKGREVIVSRGQLVEIGGSFRVPEVMAKSGAVLREVGATNRTHLRDYEAAIGPDTGAIMRVHASNFRMVGFTKEVPLAELVELGRTHGLPVIDDLGGGNLFDFAQVGLPGEPTVQRTVADGADVVSFSGDKALGGPQAGIIVGKRKFIDIIRKNPLNRALRIDKMTLAALEATLRLYLDPDLTRREVPTLAMICATAAELKTKAGKLARLLRKSLGSLYGVELKAGASQVGGGTFPERDLPTTLVCLTPTDGSNLEGLRARLLATDPPVVGRVEEDRFCLDVRTLGDTEFQLVARALAQAAGIREIC